MITTYMAIARSRVRQASLVAALVTAAPAVVAAQGGSVGESPLRVTAITGGLSHRSAVIADPLGAGDTRLGSGPVFGVELQYQAMSQASLYGGGAVSFSTLVHGTNLGVVARGSASDATLIIGTGGVVLAGPEDWFGAFRPTLRLGGGVKRYSFTTGGASSFVTGTGDFGLGFRSGTGPIEISAEVRYLPSAFDQAKLPTRGIAPQSQQQNDLLFGIGVTVRP